MTENDNEIAFLRKEIENLRFMISTEAQRESKAIGTFGAVGTMLVVAFVGVMALSFYNSYDSTKRTEDRTEEILSQAEKRVNDLLGLSAPSAAYVDNRYSDNSGNIVGQATLSGDHLDDDGKPHQFVVKVTIPFRVGIRSTATAKILGFEYKFSKDLPQLLNDGVAQETLDEYIRSAMSYSYQPATSEGVLVSPQAAANVSYSSSFRSLNCEEIKMKFEKLIQEKFVGTITVKPVLEKKSDQTDIIEKTFRLSFVDSSLYKDCKQLEN